MDSLTYFFLSGKGETNRLKKSSPWPSLLGPLPQESHDFEAWRFIYEELWLWAGAASTSCNEAALEWSEQAVLSARQWRAQGVPCSGTQTPRNNPLWQTTVVGVGQDSKPVSISMSDDHLRSKYELQEIEFFPLKFPWSSLGVNAFQRPALPLHKTITPKLS